MTATVPDAPQLHPGEVRTCHHCRAPIIRCDLSEAGYLTRCRGWVHVGPDGSEGRHYCGRNAAETTAQPREDETRA